MQRGLTVTPCVGVWIEIHIPLFAPYSGLVTPCVGVWIEIENYATTSQKTNASLPAWECGLKSSIYYWTYWTRRVTPCVGVWIEIPSIFSER